MTGEERVKMVIGEMVVSLQMALAEIEELKKRLLEKDKDNANREPDR